ncbi:MAG: hypothetical protein U1C33_00480 [Candidatus Cloacimonadaceae bacterium]|nr:hypothetical protein [Candidatus Cloacimonadaceae bacterium]
MKRLIVVVACLFYTLLLTAQAGVYNNPGDQSIMLLPTAYTMPKGSFSITDYELFVVQFTAAPTPSTHVSIVSLIPFFKDALKTFTVGVKQRYYTRDRISSAAWLSYTPDSKSMSIGNILSLGKPSESLHLGILYVRNEEDGLDSPVIFAGVRKDLSKRIALLGEVVTSIDQLSDDVDGFFGGGIRFIGDTISWELGGFRGINDDLGDIYFIPLLKATVEF